MNSIKCNIHVLLVDHLYCIKYLLGRKGKASFQRSEEVGTMTPSMMIDNQARMILRQPSKDSTDGSIGSASSDSGNALVL